MRREQYAKDKKTSKFEATDFPKEMYLANQRYFVSSARKRVLQIRRESPLVKDPVPLSDEGLTDKLYALVEIDTAGTTSLQDRPKSLYDQQVQLRTRMSEARKLAQATSFVHDVHEVVRIKDLPVFGVDISAISAIFAPRRKLRVTRAPRKPAANPQRCDIVIQILAGSNLPNTSDVTAEGLVETPASLVVECRFQSKTMRTSPLPSPNPSWHELLKLPIIPLGDSFAPANLIQMKDELYFDVFDVTVELEKPDDYRLANTRLQVPCPPLIHATPARKEPPPHIPPTDPPTHSTRSSSGWAVSAAPSPPSTKPASSKELSTSVCQSSSSDIAR